MNKIIKIGQIPSSYDMSGRVYSVNGISPTVMSNSHSKTGGDTHQSRCLFQTNAETNKIIVLGNYYSSNYDASRVVSIYGIAPCVKENHGTVTAIMEINNGE